MLQMFSRLSILFADAYVIILAAAAVVNTVDSCGNIINQRGTPRSTKQKM